MFNFFKKNPKRFISKDYVLFNVETFNTWFQDENNGAVYANKGIYLRINKLSIAHIYDYLIKCHGFTIEEISYYLDESKIYDFYNNIVENWRKNN